METEEELIDFTSGSTEVDSIRDSSFVCSVEEEETNYEQPHHEQPHHEQPHHEQPHHEQPHYEQPHHKQPHHELLHHEQPHHELLDHEQLNNIICDSIEEDISTIIDSNESVLELHSIIDSFESENIDEHTSSDKELDNILFESEVFSSLCDFESEPSQISSLNRKIETVDNETKLNKRSKPFDSSPEDTRQNIEISGFLTGNNEKIVLPTKKQPKFIKSGVGRPARSFLKPEKGHKNTLKEEQEKYIETFKKVASRFKKDEYLWLRVQFRWVWIHLNLNDLPLDIEEFLKHIHIRKSTEYSILRRIVEGDDVSFRYMILLVIDTGDDFIEGYDGFYSVQISVDFELQKEIKSKKLQIGTKIKLFGCKMLIESGCSIFELKKSIPVMCAYYNGFSYASRTRKLGYKKKISFKRSINTIKENGGPVSCVVGNVKKIIETKYVVQVKDYRNTVDDIEREFENIMFLIEKYGEKLTDGDVKVRPYVRFILDDGFSECLITSWMYVDKIRVGDRIMLCNAEPVLKSIGLHLTITKRTYLKFLT